MAELLVKAKDHWMDSLKQEDIDKLSDHQKEAYEARTRKGDIIVVRPDGWKWGKEECPPNFVVIKLPEVKYEDAKKYEDSLMEENESGEPKTLKTRQYAVDVDTVNSCILEAKGQKELSKTVFDTKLTQKVS